MSLEATLLEIVGPEEPDGAPRVARASLAEFVSPDIEERAALEANRWIKALRGVRIGGASLRDLLTYRGDSLWWFVELYLHKRGRITDWHRAVLTIEALLDRVQPRRIRWLRGDTSYAALAAEVARGRHVPFEGGRPARPWRLRLQTERQSYLWALLAYASRLKPRRAVTTPRGTIVAYVHAAFWRRGGEDGGEEGYLAPTLAALEQRVGREHVSMVGLGPSTNFRARSWRSVIAHDRHLPERLTPIEAHTPWSALRPSRALWRRRRTLAAALTSPAMRAATRIRGCDAWPFVAEELRGVALLQLPWSARAMDEAGASLDRLSPTLVLTYAEAGGWGRALMLEARRRSVPTVGLQHGFIYRHWLNYLHEPDEMAASSANPADRGFPHPDLTLLFDGFAEMHLTTAGAFPAGSLRVAGSPGLDRLAARHAGVTPASVAAARLALDIPPGDDVVLVVSKASQIGRFLPGLLAAASSIGGVRIVIKPHPAETSEGYCEVGRHDTVRVSTTIELDTLIAMARLIVTVHSTVAVDGLALALPALVLGLPSNLSPFVDAGAMAGVAAGAPIEPVLARLLRDEPSRARLLDAGRAFAARYAMTTDGGAASRAADAIIELARRRAAARK